MKYRVDFVCSRSMVRGGKAAQPRQPQLRGVETSAISSKPITAKTRSCPKRLHVTAFADTQAYNGYNFIFSTENDIGVCRRGASWRGAFLRALFRATGLTPCKLADVIAGIILACPGDPNSKLILFLKQISRRSRSQVLISSHNSAQPLKGTTKNNSQRSSFREVVNRFAIYK